MLLVLIAVLSLPHLDPRKARDIPEEHYKRMVETRDSIQQKYSQQTDLGRILFRIEATATASTTLAHESFFSDYSGNVLTTEKRSNFQLRAMQNFVTSIEDTIIQSRSCMVDT